MRAFFVAASVAVSAAVLFPAPARAQTALEASTAKVFVTVDEFKIEAVYNRITVTGILQGEAQSSSWRLSKSGYASDAGAQATFVQACQAQALLAMSKPGEYLFEILSGVTSNYGYCKLSRVKL